ncbi:FmdB family zinc ribbon protein [Thermodesulfovibrio thiophilus]|uniref:FmdB family zinc ribbon protein n=1 Tax=Thermodesulfovibrio thiophilus TaxID=340095 RepID=UPI000A045DAF|nr:FmdB family zinc ribbon protein [Thermodesulfovibrio thiophilus]
MPIYEYKCLSCGKISEYLVGLMQKNYEIVCKYCGSKNIQKIFSSVNISTESLSKGGKTCCGRTERCDSPPCSAGESCRRNK